VDGLRARAPESRVIVVSGLVASRMEPTAVARGAAWYLEKGATLAEIRAAVREVGQP